MNVHASFVLAMLLLCSLLITHGDHDNNNNCAVVYKICKKTKSQQNTCLL